jgi:hypothetical protein
MGDLAARVYPRLILRAQTPGCSQARAFMSKPPTIRLDHKHCRAICDEIGYRLSVLLRPETALPERLQLLLDRLVVQELLHVDSPSISPGLSSNRLLEPAQTPADVE